MRNIRFPEAPKVADNPCGEVVTFYWGGEYTAACIRPAGCLDYHSDGIALAMTEKAQRRLAAIPVPCAEDSKEG